MNISALGHTRPPFAVAWDADDQELVVIFADEVKLGQRYDWMVFFKSSPSFTYEDFEYWRMGLEPHGTLVVMP